MSAPDPVSIGAGAPPRANGELVFDEPWESRAFGAAVALHDVGAIDFERFRARLIRDISAWEAAHGPDADGYRYYEVWLGALEETVVEHGLATADELTRARRRIEHDRAHDHDHDH